MSRLTDQKPGGAPGVVDPGSGVERADAVAARAARRWLRRAASPAGGSRAPDAALAATLEPAAVEWAGVAEVGGVAPVVSVATAAAVPVAQVAPVAPVTQVVLEGSGEPRRRRLRWVGWIKGRVIHGDRAPKFT